MFDRYGLSFFNANSTTVSVKERLHYTPKLGGGFPALLEMGIFCLSTKKYKDEIYPSGLTAKKFWVQSQHHPTQWNRRDGR
jgi:hypothetical protein